ncbi:unnamed protein product [Agarophyton chilense]
MEGQFAVHALLIEQQRRIKALEAELASTQMELVRLRATHNPLIDSSHPSPPPPTAHQQQCAHDDAKKTSSRYWTPDEHNRFLEGLRLFGQKDIKAIARHVGTRNATQVRTHAQKYYLRIERERAKAANDLKSSQKPSSSKSSGPIVKSEAVEQPIFYPAASNSNSHTNSLNNSASSTPNVSSNPNPGLSNPQRSTLSSRLSPPSASTPPADAAPPLQFSSESLPSTPSPGLPHPVPVKQQLSPPSATSQPPAVTAPPTLQVTEKQDKSKSPAKAIPPKSSKRPPPSASHRSPRKRAKPSATKQSPTLTTNTPGSPTRSASTPPPPPSSSASPPDSDSQKDKSAKPETAVIPLRSQTHAQQRTVHDLKASVKESGGSIANFRTWMRAMAGDDVGPSAFKPPAMRRNGSSNSVLAELSKNAGVLSRSNSFVLPTGKGVTRSNSILSLLSGIPTVMRESPSTDRLLGLDTSDDKVLAALKAVDAAGNAAVVAGQTMTANNSLGTMGDRTFSFSQLNHMGFDDLEDTGAVALAIQDDQKWSDT